MAGGDSWQLDERSSSLAAAVRGYDRPRRRSGPLPLTESQRRDHRRHLVVPVAPSGRLTACRDRRPRRHVDRLTFRCTFDRPRAPPRTRPLELGGPRATGTGRPGRRAPAHCPRYCMTVWPTNWPISPAWPELTPGPGGGRRPGAFQRGRPCLGRGPAGHHRPLVRGADSRWPVRWPRPWRIWGPGWV